MALLKFPENIDNYPIYVKYSIYAFNNSGTIGNSVGDGFTPAISKQIQHSICLSLNKEEISIDESQNWSMEETSKLAMVAMGVKQGVSGDAGAGSAIGGIIDGIKDQVGTTINQAVDNPLRNQKSVDKMSLNYGGPTLRAFNMNHTFIPRSKPETDKIYQIINIFRHASAPEKGAGSTSITYKLPHIFKMEYMMGENQNKWLPRYDFAYCKSVSVKYSDTTFADDTAPTSLELSLSFEELTFNDKNRIERNFPNVPYNRIGTGEE